MFRRLATTAPRVSLLSRFNSPGIAGGSTTGNIYSTDKGAAPRSNTPPTGQERTKGLDKDKINQKNPKNPANIPVGKGRAQ
jgi:hypothetical protein